MVRVLWTETALRDLELIHAYIRQFSPMAAGRFAERLRAAGEGLREQPERGRAIRGLTRSSVGPLRLVEDLSRGQIAVRHVKTAALAASSVGKGRISQSFHATTSQHIVAPQIRK